MAHPNVSLRFQVTGQRVKKIIFSLISFAFPQNTLSACCGLNFDATDLPNRGLSIYYVVQIRGPERPLRGGLPTLCNIVKKEKGENIRRQTEMENEENIWPG